MIFNKEFINKLLINGWCFSQSQKELFKYYYNKKITKIGIQKPMNIGYIIIGNNERLFLSQNELIESNLISI